MFPPPSKSLRQKSCKQSWLQRTELEWNAKYLSVAWGVNLHKERGEGPWPRRQSYFRRVQVCRAVTSSPLHRNGRAGSLAWTAHLESGTVWDWAVKASIKDAQSVHSLGFFFFLMVCLFIGRLLNGVYLLVNSTFFF